MRWLFLILLALNLGYLAWELNRPAEQARPVRSQHPDVPAIMLLSETRQPAAKSARGKQGALDAAEKSIAEKSAQDTDAKATQVATADTPALPESSPAAPDRTPAPDPDPPHRHAGYPRTLRMPVIPSGRFASWIS